MTTVPRIWDPFLTDRERINLAAIEDKRVGFGNKPALLLVDLYWEAFGGKPQEVVDGIKGEGNCDRASAWRALPYIKQLLNVAREVQIPIVHISRLDGVGIRGWMEDREISDNSPEGQERFKHRSDIIDEVVPREGEAVLRKSASSAFWGTPLVGHLNYLGVDTVIVCGEATSGCVRATVVDACTYRYKVIIVEECVFDVREVSHAISLFDMHLKYGDVLPLTEVVGFLSNNRAKRH